MELLEKKINILKNTFNLDNIDLIIPKIKNLNIEPILDIMYCYLDKPYIIHKIFNQYSSYELNIISYIIKLKVLSYNQCVELLNLNGLQIRLNFYIINAFFCSNINHVNKISSIFEIFKNMDNKSLINFYKIKHKINPNISINFMNMYYISVLLNNEQIDTFINSMNNGYSYNDSYFISLS